MDSSAISTWEAVIFMGSVEEKLIVPGKSPCSDLFGGLLLYAPTQAKLNEIKHCRPCLPLVLGHKTGHIALLCES